MQAVVKSKLFNLSKYKKSLLLLWIVLAGLAIFSCKKTPETATIKTIPEKKMVDAYTEVQYGNMPLLISVPHGGTVSPASIPDRTCAGITTVTDNNTIELLMAIDSVCKADYGLQPYYVLTYLKRIKLDQNRDYPEATCSNTALYNYWSAYHESLDTCIRKIISKYPQCLFIDLHGHGHTKQQLELGYLVDANGLQNPATIVPSTTSLYHLLQQNSNLTLSQMLIGTNAFGTMIAINGFPSVPSQQTPAPAIGDPFFAGGYNTQRFTGSTYPNAFGWQIESNYTGVRDNKNSWIAFAKAFLRSVMQYYTSNTGMQPAGFGK